jgi:hypothetical protein
VLVLTQGEQKVADGRSRILADVQESEAPVAVLDVLVLVPQRKRPVVTIKRQVRISAHRGRHFRLIVDGISA